MNNLPLPQHINLLRLSEMAHFFHGALLIKDLPRLVPSLFNTEGEAKVNLEFNTDSEGIVICHVQLTSQLNLQCQRCMEPFIYEIISDFLQGIANSETEAEGLSERYEPFVAKDGLLIVQDMIEDELILKLPIVPMHALEACKVHVPVVDTIWREAEGEKLHPFHKLRLLKNDTK